MIAQAKKGFPAGALISLKRTATSLYNAHTCMRYEVKKDALTYLRPFSRPGCFIVLNCVKPYKHRGIIALTLYSADGIVTTDGVTLEKLTDSFILVGCL